MFAKEIVVVSKDINSVRDIRYCMSRKIATIEFDEENNGYISSRVKYDDPKISEHKKMAIWITFETIDRNFNTVYRLSNEEIHTLRNVREDGDGSVIPTLAEMLLLKGDEVPMLLPKKEKA